MLSSKIIENISQDIYVGKTKFLEKRMNLCKMEIDN